MHMPNNTQPQNNPTVSYGKNVKSRELESVTLSEVLNTIQTGNNGIKENIETIRACQEPEQRKELKQLLPYFILGTFKDCIRNNANFERTQFILLDVDHVGIDNVLAIKNQLAQDPNVYAVAISPSGDGLKVIYKLENPITVEAIYRATYLHLSEQFHQKYSIEPDTTIDPARACYMTYDPDLYVNEQSIPVSIVPQSKAKSGPKSKSSPLGTLLATGTTPGNRTHVITQIVGHCVRAHFDKDATVEVVKMWNQKNTPPHTDKKIVDTVNNMYQRYDKTKNIMPFEIVEKDGLYYRVNEKRGDSMITSFTVEPKELLVLEDGDCLRATVTTPEGSVYEDVLIENTDWHTKGKLLKALKHQDLTFHGSEFDVQALCRYVNARVPIKKKGTRVIGLLTEEQTWVTEGLNITKEKISTAPDIISYDKGASAFYKGIAYKQLSDDQYTVLVSGLYTDIFQINEQNIIVPWLSWVFATPVKPLLMESVGGFPLAFVHGPQGSGKTTSARLLNRLSGYRNPKPFSCRENWFPMLKLLTSTNAIPICLDEFKATLLNEKDIKNIIAFMNKSYSGEIEVKGRADQTTKDYVISAPMCVMGEWNISVPSVHERILVIRFKETVKKDKAMQAALDRVWNLPLESFMPRYIQFCLQQDVQKMFDIAKQQVKECFSSIVVAPRIVNNLSVMLLGLELFTRFGKEQNVVIPNINIPDLLKHQLREITGSKSGFVQSAVDQLINELSNMALKEKPITEFGRDMNGPDCKIRNGYDYKQLTLQDKLTGNSVDVLAINFSKIFPDFKLYASQTKYEGDLLDKESYLRQFDECAYVMKKDHPVNFNDKAVRSLCLDIMKAQNAGINLEGFGIAA